MFAAANVLNCWMIGKPVDEPPKTCASGSSSVVKVRLALPILMSGTLVLIFTTPVFVCCHQLAMNEPAALGDASTLPDRVRNASKGGGTRTVNIVAGLVVVINNGDELRVDANLAELRRKLCIAGAEPDCVIVDITGEVRWDNDGSDLDRRAGHWLVTSNGDVGASRCAYDQGSDWLPLARQGELMRHIQTCACCRDECYADAFNAIGESHREVC